MSTSTSQIESYHRKEAKLKTIVGEILEPLLKRLELVREHYYCEESYKLVKEMKVYFDAREELERDVIDKLGKIERELDCRTPDLFLPWVELKKHWSDIKSNKALNALTQLDFGKSANSNNQEKEKEKEKEKEREKEKEEDACIELEQCMEELQERHLKGCLLSLAIFPENKELKKRLLVYWWIGIGIASRENENKTDENLGEEYFSELVEKGVLKPVLREHNQVVDRCTINPKIHRQLNRLIASCWIREGSSFSISNKKAEDDDGTWHFCEYDFGGSKVNALLNFDIKYLNSRGIISQMKGTQVQVLQLGRWREHDHVEVDATDFLREMDQSLKYLSLQGISGITNLPQSIGELGDLRILDLRACHNLECLPQKPRSKLEKIFAQVLPQQSKKWFDNLTHLDISECLLLDSLPKWICELSNLQVLKGFVVGYLGKQNQFCQLRDLLKLKKLRKLNIKIADQHFNLTDISYLEPLDNLLVLTIIWTIHDQTDSSGAPSNKISVLYEGKNAGVEKQSKDNGEGGCEQIPKGDNAVEAEQQSKENTPESLNVTDVAVEQIRGENGSKTMIAEKHDRENLQNGLNISRVRSEKKGVNEGKIPVEKKPSKNNISRPEERPEKNKDCTISFPKNLDKLDIRCYPNDEATEFLKSASLQNLKRLYIRGGKLVVIRDDTPWEVEILRLRFLKFFDFDWYKLSSTFLKLKYLEYEACSRLTNFPRDRSFWKPEQDGDFPSGLFDDDEEVVLSPNSESSRPISNRSGRATLDLRVTLDVQGSEIAAPLFENRHILWLKLIANHKKFYQDRDGLDLVVVLDISQSTKEKLPTMKSTILEVMDELSPIDRLSIVTFHTIAKRVCGLFRVTDSFKAKLKDLINSLEAGGDTNTFDGLHMGLKVLKDRRLSIKRAVRILLMSSGAETIRFGDPTTIELGNVPVHTMQFYRNIQDPWRVSRVLNAIADNSHGGKYRKIVEYSLSELHGITVEGLTLTITPNKEEATVVDVREASNTDHEMRFSKHKNDVGSVIVGMGRLYEGKPKVFELELSLPSTDKEHRATVVQISYSYEFRGEKFEEAPVTVCVDRTERYYDC